MLQPSTATPLLSNTTGLAGVPVYSFSSNCRMGENEYTWWRTVSRLGKLTAVPRVITSTSGTNALFCWPISAPAMGLAARAASGESRNTTAPASGAPLAS